MTSTDEHRRKIQEHLEEIDDAVEEGAERKPVTIGFHCSACCVQFLEFYLHSTNRIPVGKVIKHDWFKRPKPEQKIEPLIERKLKTMFPKKDEIYNMIYDLEDERNSLVYGKPSDKQVKEVVIKFLKLKKLFLEIFENEKLKI